MYFINKCDVIIIYDLECMHSVRVRMSVCVCVDVEYAHTSASCTDLVFDKWQLCFWPLGKSIKRN